MVKKPFIEIGELSWVMWRQFMFEPFQKVIQGCSEKIKNVSREDPTLHEHNPWGHYVLCLC